MVRFIFIPSILAAFAFTGCKKEAVDIDPEFAGFWMTSVYGPYDGSTVTINDNSTSRAHSQPCCGAGSENDYTGEAKIRNDYLYIGRFQPHIDGYPNYDTAGNYVLVLDGITYYKVMAVKDMYAAVSGTSVTFSWNNHSVDLDQVEMLGEYYTIDYRLQNTSAWTEITLPVNSGYTHQVTGLAPASAYEWKMKGTAGGKNSDYSAILTFSTP